MGWGGGGMVTKTVDHVLGSNFLYVVCVLITMVLRDRLCSPYGSRYHELGHTDLP